MCKEKDPDVGDEKHLEPQHNPLVSKMAAGISAIKAQLHGDRQRQAGEESRGHAVCHSVCWGFSHGKTHATEGSTSGPACGLCREEGSQERERGWRQRASK